MNFIRRQFGFMRGNVLVMTGTGMLGMRVKSTDNRTEGAPVKSKEKLTEQQDQPPLQW